MTDVDQRSERVDVDVDASEFVDLEDGTDAASSEAASSGATRRGFMSMLTATSPAESPQEQEGTFSTDAEWYQHLELGMKKATGAEGTPAWANLVMSTLLLFAESAGVLPNSSDEGEASDLRADPGEGDLSRPDETASVDTRPPTAENGETSIIQ